MPKFLQTIKNIYGFTHYLLHFYRENVRYCWSETNLSIALLVSIAYGPNGKNFTNQMAQEFRKFAKDFKPLNGRAVILK